MTTLEATCRYPFVPEMGGRTTFDGDALTPPGVSPLSSRAITFTRANMRPGERGISW